MAEELKPDIDIEAELNRALEEKDENGSRLNDLKIYFRCAFKRFDQKLAVVGTLFTIFGIIIFEIIRPSLSEIIQSWVLGILLVLFIFIVCLVVLRANSKLVKVAKNLAKKSGGFVFEEKRYKAHIDSLIKKRDSYKDLFESNSTLYGISIDKYETMVEINKQGACEISCELSINAARNGMRAIERFSQIIFSPFEDDFDLKIPKREFVLENGNFVLITPEVIRKEKDRIEWLLTADPEFPVNLPIKYAYTQKTLDQAFSMDMDELDNSKNPLEWFSQQITYPTKRLFIKVIFPEGYRPVNSDVAVWVTSNVKHNNETEYNRIKNSGYFSTKLLEKDRIAVLIEMEFPIVGMHYGISWKPMLEWKKD